MALDIKDDERLAYAPAEAARLIGHSRSGFYLLLASNAIPSFKVGRRRLIRRSDLLAFMERALGSTPEEA
ncbi:helix-turn-helix domain-containing protein [Bradyrhizobium sp. SRS-191]|uniref:helix-turn-helix domain-containing protein n=1 Tax=Bradyrhizobium sp. SRS-191 TaxID=2962606 RepID=UPI00211DCC79|nr:helix-turn-helix domain-containing protein [Bradyrhizobium sp. SRS-191]